MKILKKAVCLLLVLLFSVAAFSCGKKDSPDDTGVPHDSDASGDSEIKLETIVPDIINPLTGLEGNFDTSGKRPAAVMLNNIYQALPQVGISNADILFECLAEGGITRLEGVFSEYKDVGVIGSVRSSRPYYIDFAQMFDAVYCHAGGSEDAYSQMASRSIDHIDGVRGGTDPLGIFYRDPERLKTKAKEHTMMTTGEGIANTVEARGIRTELRDGFKMPWEFAEYGKEIAVGQNESQHIYLPISNYQTVDYQYDSASKLYKRFQYNGEKHIDGENGEQIAFTNVIVLFCDTAPYDSYGRLKVTTTGSGSGYLASGGKYAKITWSRTDIDGNLTLTGEDGKTITINRGKTVINVCPATIADSVNMNDADRQF